MSTTALQIPANTKRYSDVTAQKSDGAHYTPTRLADFVASQLINAIRQSTITGSINLLDPAIGDGELVLSFLNQLSEVELTRVSVTAFDTQEEALSIAQTRLAQRFPGVRLDLRCGSFLEFVLTEFPNADGSLFEPSSSPFDAIIANPPYVRTQVLGADQAQELARDFGLTGRVDLYHAFLLGMARVLRPAGHASIIVSNRFMTTKSGVSVRADIVDRFDPEHIWDLGDTKLFAAAVLPAVLLLRKKDGTTQPEPKLTTIYTTKEEGDASECGDTIDALCAQGLVKTADGQRYTVRQGSLHFDRLGETVWRVTCDTTTEWLEQVKERTWCTFGELGGVRVGVKTTADKVFIRTDWDTMPAKPELLRPLTTHFIARRFRPTVDPKKRAILYPHTVIAGKRQAADLEKYPISKQYLELHRDTLEGRQYVTASGRNWFEIWVPQDPSLWDAPKLVFRDISEVPTFWVDLEGTVINGDCYWLPFPKESDEDLLWLSVAVANSTFIEAFYDKCFNNKLYAGRRRFMTQYVEKFPIPDPRAASSMRIVEMAKSLYEAAESTDTSHLERELDALIWAAFGFSGKEIIG